MKAFEQEGCMDAVEDLQNHENQLVWKATNELITWYNEINESNEAEEKQGKLVAQQTV